MAMMISKFHKLVGSKKVWTVFAVLISAAFVIAYTGGKSGRQQARPDASSETVGKLYNEKVSRHELSREYQNTYLMLILRTGKPLRITEQIDQLLKEQAWQRLAILKKAAKMGLVVSKEQLVTAIRQQPVFLNQQTGQFDRQAYDAFFAQILPRIGVNMSPKGFETMISENLLIEKASSMAIQSALVTDAEVDHAFHVYSDKLTVQYASIPQSLATPPETTEADAREYYNKYPNQFTYPDKVKVRYVDFPVADYTADIEVTDEMLAQVYDDNKQMFMVEGTEDSASPEYKPLEEVKDTIIEEIKGGMGRKKAANDAGLFVSKLSSQAGTFDKLAQDAGKTIASTPPFALTDTVRDIDPTANFARAAFGLEDDANHYYSDPVIGKEHVYILVLQSKMPSFLPGFEIVADEAMTAAKASAAEKAYAQKAEAIHADLETALKAGASFEDAASKAGLTITTTEPFSAAEPPEDDLGQNILRQTVLFDAGTLVDLIPTEEEFIVAYISAREPADRLTADPNLMAQLKASVQNDKATRLATAWRESILKEANLEIIDPAAKDNS